MRYDEQTRAYVARRTAEGLCKKNIICCLKRAIAREMYRVLAASGSPAPPADSMLTTA